MSADERAAMFYKLEHDQPVSIVGTGLKKLTESNKHITLVVPKEDNLDKFAEKISLFGTGPISKGHAPHEDFAHITCIAPGEPKDRLSDELFAEYLTFRTPRWSFCD
ncbi:MAG: hypothetical protein H8E44_20775 [Planctomycetes bacterium]|nr:hypothetical protein [Planctomycetota bacterium]